jgi:hypothetical protein
MLIQNLLVFTLYIGMGFFGPITADLVDDHLPDGW